MVKDNEGLLKDKSVPVSRTLKRMAKYFKPEIWKFIFSLLLIVLNVGLDLVYPIIMGKLTDYLSDSNLLNIELSFIIGLSVGLMLVIVTSQVILYFESMILTKAGQKIIYNLRMEVFEHIEAMSQNQFNDMAVGSLVTRVCNYTSSMSDFFTNTLVNIIRDLLTAIVVFMMMIFISPKLALVLLMFVIIVFVTSFFFSKYVHKLFGEERNNLSELNTYLNESLSGMKVIQLFNQEKRCDDIFSMKNAKLRKTRYKWAIAFGLYRPFISFLDTSAIAAIFYFGTLPQVGLTAGEIVSFYLLLSKFFKPIQQLADQLNHITRALTNSERLFNLLDIPPEVIDEPDAIEIEQFKGKIEFKNVWFAYEKDNWILKDVSFVINPKETVAFVGATGAGKTTILGLIVRNFDIQKGQILIDDIDIKHIKVSSLRRSIGQMLQDVFLFSGTIKDNVTLFDNEISDEEVIEACDYVNFSPIVNKLEKGLNEEVIERGENFSTGQRQLLSFARTVLSKPQIMILDEATANIDTETELVIQDSLEKMKSIGTMLVVAHRLSTIQHADNIIVLSKGEVIEHGNHQELLKQKGHYYKLYQLQFKD